MLCVVIMPLCIVVNFKLSRYFHCMEMADQTEIELSIVWLFLPLLVTLLPWRLMRSAPTSGSASLWFACLTLKTIMCVTSVKLCPLDNVDNNIMWITLQRWHREQHLSLHKGICLRSHTKDSRLCSILYDKYDAHICSDHIDSYGKMITYVVMLQCIIRCVVV